MTASATSPAPPNRYEVHGHLGSGGVGHVHRAWDTQLGRWVALKRLHKTDEAASDTWHEASILAALQHPHIVTVYDFGHDNQGPFVVMELLEGENLEQTVQRGVLALPEFLLVARQSLEAVIAAHHAGLIHRDLKPGNVMLTPLASGGYQVKLLDFGLARFISSPRHQTVDQAGNLLGSIHTMSPEQLNQQALDARTDLYALGCVFYYILAGHYPFRGATTTDVMIAHLQHHVTPLEEIRRDLPPHLCRWIMRLLEREPAQRPASAADALDHFQRMFPIPLSGKVTTASLPSGHGRRFYSIITVFSVLLLVSMPAAFRLWKQKSNPSRAPSPMPDPASAAPRIQAEAAPAPPEPAASPQTPPPQISSEASEDAIAVTDLATLKSKIGQTVTVTGTPVRIGSTRAGDKLFVNFATKRHEALTLVFPATPDNASALRSTLQNLIGKKIRLEGPLSEFQGEPEIVVDELERVRIAE